MLSSTMELNNGLAIPVMGLGVYRSMPGKETRRAVDWALEAGYRHFDTASVYKNEADVGASIRASRIPRNQIFVTTKLANADHGYDQALTGFEASLEQLALDYVDLYLIHWPVAQLRRDSWRALEHIYAQTRARAIGVSNYMVRHLQELLASCQIKPAVNQIELHPFIYRKRADTVAFCQQHNIAVEAYSPLTKARRMNDPRITSIAQAHHKSPAQVLIRYVLDKQCIVLPKSVHRPRIRENSEVFDFHLTAAETAILDALNEGLATGWDPTDAP